MPDEYGQIINGDALITGNLRVTGEYVGGFSRSEIEQESLAEYPISLLDWRIHDAPQSLLTGTAGSGDLALLGATFGTDFPYLQTSDAKATTVTERGRRTITLPPEYVAGETVKIRVAAGMKTTVSDGTATVDIEVWKSDRDRTIGGSDICATAAQSINSLTMADKDFTITATTLVPGDELDVRLTIAITDGATVTAVLGTVGAVDLLLDIKG